MRKVVTGLAVFIVLSLSIYGAVDLAQNGLVVSNAQEPTPTPWPVPVIPGVQDLEATVYRKDLVWMHLYIIEGETDQGPFRCVILNQYGENQLDCNVPVPLKFSLEENRK